MQGLPASAGTDHAMPPPALAAAQRRLRRQYLIGLTLLGVPVLCLTLYLLALQFQLVWVGTQRQIAMSADRRVTRLDGLLGGLRSDLLRLRDAAREPSLPREVPADAESLRRVGTVWTLDDLPPLLADVAPQVLLAGPAWEDEDAREASLGRAARFAEQARLMLARSGGFRRVWFVDAAGGELWTYPWLPSSELVGELGLDPASPQALAASLPRLAERHAAAAAVTAVADDIVWRRGEGPSTVSASVAIASDSRPGLVAAELPEEALAGVRIESGLGRFWVLGPGGDLVLDQRSATPSGPAVNGGVPPPVDDARLPALLTAPLAEPVGPLLLAVRRSGVAPWTAYYAADAAQIRGMVLRDLGPYAGGGLALLVLFGGVGYGLWRRFGRPSLQLVDYLRRQSLDAGAAEPDVPSAWAPWMHLTRDTFAAWRDAAAREQRSEALKASIVDHALAAVITTDEAGRIVEFNPAAQQMFSRPREAVIGECVSDLIVPEHHRAAHTAGMARLAAGESPRLMGRRLEMTALRADGSEFPVEMVIWRTAVGGRSFYTASMFDLTERQRAQGEIERQREALRQSEKLTAMGSLLAGVAHELNNPLAIVMGRATLLQAKAGDPALQEDAQRIREAAERCGRIVRTFLNMARQRPDQRGAMQLNDLARAAVELLGYTLRSSSVSVEWALDPALPTVEADADRVGQVVLNLIVNAQQAMAAQPFDPARPRRLRLASGHDARGAWLQVSDSGPGVPPALRARIFEAFFTTKAEGVGTGLGLSVALGVARAHGGDLELRPDLPGEGACFTLRLPYGAAMAEPPAPPPEAAEGLSRRVLVVDDEAEIADMMRDMLESGGYEVATAESGEVALELLREARFDAVVSDLRMPDLDGPALWREIGRQWPALARRMVFVTGDTLSPGAAEFIAQTGCPALEKPFLPNELLGRVGRLLESAAETNETPAATR